MSTTLVETFSFPPPHQTLAKDAVRSQQLVPLVTTPPSSGQYTLSIEEQWAVQLAHLASQHHTSEYNRIKFGPQGCPTAYIPLSISMPGHVAELQARQAEQAKDQAWWLCDGSSRIPRGGAGSSSVAAVDEPIILGPCGNQAYSDLNLQEEISAAISAPLPSSPQMPPIIACHPQLKTSETHPINISTVIPSDLLPIISSHLVPARKPWPTLFDISPSHTLDRLAGPKFLLSSPNSHFPITHVPQSSHVPTVNMNTHPALIHLRSRSSVSEALQAAINSGLAAAAHVPPVPRINYDRSTSAPIQLIPSIGRQHTSDASVLNEKISSVLAQNRAYSAPPLSASAPESPEPPRSLFLTSKVSASSSGSASTSIPSNTLSQPAHSILKERSAGTSFISVNTQGSSSITLGNLYLSSCPGKKVRLDGPVRGRSSVCRDLTTDLRRMKDLRIGCIICCLDDSELEFLGAPWSEYSDAANKIGLDVLRMPTPEGLAPLSPIQLDEHLSRLIDTYTLRGVAVLVHCRGGVGRAGLIACCWMLKLGLCGWIETDPGATVVRRDTIQLVERVLAVVRRRRSLKAVETFEQVKFLVDYVEYLRMGGC